MSMHFETPTKPATGTVPTVSSGKPAREKQSHSENPPCVVGMACRVPGASSPSQLWDNIVNQVDLQRKMPQDRFNVDAFYHPDGTHKGTTNAKYGYFLDQDLGLFDASFFNISGKEAEAMDPQQRLLLEVVYEALEDAGITLDEIQGSLTSVYCGCFTNDYNAMTTKDLEYYPKYTVTGTGNSILANRISYFYNLHGPSATVDTACSSSLVCFHLGAQSLRDAEADISIVVGSALHFDPNIFITMTDLGMLSTDGRCRHGDAAGSGYVRGEGIAAMVLKRQDRAQADGDHIRAVVRGTGVNHDGRKQGITLPSARAQADLITSTYERAGLEPAETTYVECHGTGTKAGDPRELRAVHEVFCRHRPDTLHVGSVKTNIGHLEGASGIAGLMKATMALEKKIIPPNMHFSTPNPEVDFENWKLEIPIEPKVWEMGRRTIPRRASINSFGYGGTNAHAILEEYSSSDPSTTACQQPIVSLPPELAAMVECRPYLVPLTSHSERAGELWAERLAQYLAENGPSVADVALSLSTRRTMHRFRSFAVSADMEKVIERIRDPPPGAAWKSKLDTLPRIGFVFTGQGAQWFGMARSLLEQCPLFLQTIRKCDRILQALPSHRPTWSVEAELQKSQQDTMLGRTEYSQPICTAIQLALVDVLAHWGVKPSGVVGHSSGELAATYAAGLLSFENALVAAYYRGVHMGSGAAAPGSVPGAMMAVGMTEAEVTAELEPYRGRIAIAAMNSPSSFTVSGDEDAVVELQQTLTDRKVFARRLQVAQAFHSHHMFPLAPGYKEALSAYPGFKANKEPSAVMVSSVTGRYADPETLGPDYLAANMTGMVKFSDALTELVLDEEDQQRIDVFLEVGPHPALKGPSNQTLDPLKLKLPYFGTLDRKQDAYESLLATTGQLFALGYPVDLKKVNENQFLDTTGQIVSVGAPGRLELPSYAWDHHDRYWAETRHIREHRLRPSRHSILGARVPGSLETRPRWRNYLRVSELPWLPDHSIDGKTIFPAAGYINMVIEAAATMVDGSIREFELVDVSVKSALVVSDKDVGTETIVELNPAVESAETSSSLWKQFVVLSVDEAGNQREHCTGMIRTDSGSPKAIQNSSNYSSMDAFRRRSFRSTERTQYYHRLHSMGLQYGPTFQLVAGNVESGDGIAIAPISWKPTMYPREDTDLSILHPALLDACLHPVFSSIEGKSGNNLSAPYVPTFIRSLRVSGLLDAWKRSEAGFDAEVLVETDALGPRTATNDLRLHLSDGELLFDIKGLRLTSLGSNAADDTKRSLFFGTQWKPMFTGLEWAPEEEYNLTTLVELYVHQHPNSKILHVTPSLSSTESILPIFKGIADSERRNISGLVILPAGAAATDFDALVDRGNGLVSVVEDTEDAFDLVIVSTDIDMSAIRGRVAENGFLVTLNPTKNTLDTHAFHMLYTSSVVQIWHNKHSPINGSVGTLTIVMPPQPTPATRKLADFIKSQRQGPTSERDFLSLIQSSNELHGDVVVLASLDSNLYFGSASSRAEDFQAAQALLTKEIQVNVIWLTRGGLMNVSSPEQALILGLARSARSENPELRLVVFDIDPTADESQTAQLTSHLLDDSVREDEIAERGGRLYIPRVVASDDLNSRIPNGVRSEPTIQPLYQKDRPLALRIGRPGLLDTLMFSDDTDLTSSPLQPDELEIEVKASALNFRDIAASMGIIDDFKLGDECAGVVLRVGSNVSSTDFAVGDHVVAWRPGQGAHRTILRNPACLCYRLQGQMPFSVASSIPLVLTTAYYALVDTARLQRGETILIHSAAGGVGQMAIQIAQNIGATIIATVGSAEKRAFLIDKYGLEDSHILSSRDDSFVEGIRRLTNGRGVDVVLNSLAGPLLLSTWASVAPFGRFVEIGKRDIHQNSRIPMDPFRRNVSFASVDMITVFEQNQPLGARVFQESCALVHEGKINPPQPITEVPYSDVQRAFRMLQTGTTSGKIVLIPGPDDRVLVEQPRFHRRQLFDAHKTYLLVGGLGGLGRRLSEWLFQRGARHLAFLSRSGKSRPEARETVEWLEARGVEVKVFSGDATDSTAVNTAVSQIHGSGHRLAGVFQAAMVLQDAPLAQMTFAQWQRCMAPKVQGAYNLHNATASLPLDFFVCFSSVSAILGSKAQANYSAANSYLDALCAYRRSIGLVGTTMNVGMVVGVGAVSEDAQLQTVMERIGYDAVNEAELFAQIGAAVCPVGSQDKLALVDSQGRDAHQIITGVNLRRPTYFWANEPRFRNLYANHDFSGSSEGKNKKQDVMSQLREAPDEAARVSILILRFLEKIAAVLSVDQSTLQPNRSLGDYGLDSIVAIEIRQWFFKAVGVELAMFDILSSRSIQALIEKVASLIVLKNEAESSTAANADVQKNTKRAANRTAESTISLLPPIDGASIGEMHIMEVPMSSYQRRLWFMHNLSADPSFLNLPIIFRLRGQPHGPLIRRVLEELKRRNDILRTAYSEGEEFSLQVVMDDCTTALPEVDFSTDVDTESSLNNYVRALQQELMDIEDGVVMKAALAKLSENRHALILIFHHICIDRGSSQSFLEQFTGLYDAMRKERNLASVARPAVSYGEFSIWHNSLLRSTDMQPSLAFWKSVYEDQPSTAMQLLPFAKGDRPETNDYQRHVHKTTLKKTLLQRMKRICSRLGVTPAQFLMAGLRAFLYRHTEEEDLTIHLVDGNRPHPAVNDTLGFFVNVVPVRCRINHSGSFEDVLRQIKDLVISALQHSQFPFDAIIDAIGAARTTSHFPLGQVILNYQVHGTMPVYSAGDFDITEVQGDDIPTACEIELEALEDPAEGLKLRLEYSTTLYGEDDMARFLDNFVAFLASTIHDYRQPVSEVKMVGSKELEFLKANMFNLNFVPNTWGGMSVSERILAMAREYPQEVAVESSEGVNNLTYASLVAQASDIARAIIDSGIQPASKVGLFALPGPTAVASMVGVLFAGCGYVALDTDFAKERLAFMITDSGARLVVAGDGLEDSARALSTVPVLASERIQRSGKMIDSPVPTEGNFPFYTIYTSGSTGTPKGVVLSQSNTQQMLSTLHHDYRFSSADRFLHHSSISFDLSIVQIFSALTTGARVCVAGAEIRKDPLALATYMAAAQVSITYFTPTQFAMLIESAGSILERMTNYRIAYFAGERLPVRMVKAFYDLKTPAKLYNTWSPSELVVQTTIQSVDYPADDALNIPIGFPMANTRHYILDAKAKPLPMGVVGEIVVGGAQVGLGYINRPEINERAFLPDPFCSEEDHRRGWGRMFRTGDKGRFLPGGNLEFHGRIAGDKQVKLRGYRIDLSEVEHRIFVESNKGPTDVALVDLAVVAREIAGETSQESGTDNRQLIAFVVPRQAPPRERLSMFAFQLNQMAGKYLNSYMLPAAYQFVERLPTTIGGKVDLQKLLNCPLDPVFPVEENAIPRSPAGETSDDQDVVLKAVIQGFRQILKLPSTRAVGPGDSFFALGGNSLLLMRLQARLKRALKLPLPLNTMFKTPTPAAITQLMTGRISSSATPASQTPNADAIDWEVETRLAGDVKPSPVNIGRSQVNSVLVTGVDSFIGVHMLATLLEDQSIDNIYVLGSQKQIEVTNVYQSFDHYHLSGLLPPREELDLRIRSVPGNLDSPQFGLSAAAFRQLARNIQSIYHLGGYVSLLRSYDALRDSNVRPIHDIIHLASLGRVNTAIHHLSTWSVPHLQTWSTTTHQRGKGQPSITATEVSASHFIPESSGRLGYFKSRWAAEMILEKAAKRGFAVTIYRASAVTADRRTGIPEPKDDFIRTMIVSMLQAKAVPRLPVRERPFVVDFVPVDYITSGMHALAMHESLNRETTENAPIYHLSNPQPLPVEELPAIMEEIGGERGQSLPVDEWLEAVARLDTAPEAQVRWGALKEYFGLGHLMFGLDTAKTQRVLEAVDIGSCNPVDVEYLRMMLARESQRVG